MQFIHCRLKGSRNGLRRPFFPWPAEHPGRRLPEKTFQIEEGIVLVRNRNAFIRVNRFGAKYYKEYPVVGAPFMELASRVKVAGAVTELSRRLKKISQYTKRSPVSILFSLPSLVSVYGKSVM